MSIGEEESGSELNAKQILSAYGLNSKMVKEKNLNYADAAPNRIVSPPDEQLHKRTVIKAIKSASSFFIFPPSLLLDFAQKKRNCKSTKAHNSPLFRSNYTITELPLSNEKALPKRSASLHQNVLLVEN